ncbi:MAG: hypothetical protein ACREDR_04265 [Blastocatellia bacterium]
MRYDSHQKLLQPPLDDALGRFDQAVARRHSRGVERRKSADLTVIGVSADGMPRELHNVRKGRVRIKIDKRTKSIEVFSGGERATPLALLILDPEVLAPPLFSRLLGRRSYSVCLDGGITVTFVVSINARSSSDSYPLDVLLTDARPRVAPVRSRDWHPWQWATVGGVLLLLCVIAFIWLKAAKRDGISANEKNAGHTQPAPTAPGAERPQIPPSTNAISEPRKQHRVYSGSRSMGLAAIATARLPIGDTARSGTSSGDILDDPAVLSRAYNRLTIILPEGSPSGLYRVIVEDPFRKPIMPAIHGWSPDGNSLVVGIDFRGFTKKDCRICVLSGSDAPICREIVVGDPCSTKDTNTVGAHAEPEDRRGSDVRKTRR